MGLKFFNEPGSPGCRREIFAFGAKVRRTLKSLKRSFCISIIMPLFFTGTAWAVESEVPLLLLTPDDLTFDACLAIENSQFNLTENAIERFEVINTSADRNLLLLGSTSDPENFKLLLKEYQQREAELFDYWNDLEGNDAGVVAELLLEASNNRLKGLQQILDNGNLLRAALNDLMNAIENQNSIIGEHRDTLIAAAEAYQEAQRQAEEARQTQRQADSSDAGEGDDSAGDGGTSSDQGRMPTSLSGFVPSGFSLAVPGGGPPDDPGPPDGAGPPEDPGSGGDDPGSGGSGASKCSDCGRIIPPADPPGFVTPPNANICKCSNDNGSEEENPEEDEDENGDDDNGQDEEQDNSQTGNSNNQDNEQPDNKNENTPDTGNNGQGGNSNNQGNEPPDNKNGSSDNKDNGDDDSNDDDG